MLSGSSGPLESRCAAAGGDGGNATAASETRPERTTTPAPVRYKTTTPALRVILHATHRQI